MGLLSLMWALKIRHLQLTWCIQNKIETGFDIILNLQHQLLHRTSILDGMDGIELCFASMY